MIYNQKQRQLIIWEQRETVNMLKSISLLVNLGIRISVRNFGRKFAKSYAPEMKAQPVMAMHK